jgi:hypothetical protein
MTDNEAIARRARILGRALLRVVEGRAQRFILGSADSNRVGA